MRATHQYLFQIGSTSRKTASIGLVLLAWLLPGQAWSQDVRAPLPTEQDSASQDQADSELAAIRVEAQAFVEAFNKRDAKAIADLWTLDGEYIDETGNRFNGRESIEQGYAEFFANNSASSIRVVIDSLRLLSKNAAIEEGRTMLESTPSGAPAIGKYTAVHVKEDGKWRMASVRESRVETNSAYHNVADLDWLIGTWTAEEHGVSTRSVCRWIANKSFVERSYTITNHDGSTASGVQLIGWNPLDGHVQSWTFSSDGGHAVGIWSPHPGGWIAEMNGVTGNGTTTRSTNLLTRLDDDAYVWQSVDRTAGDVSLPDTEQVVLKRQPDRR